MEKRWKGADVFWQQKNGNRIMLCKVNMPIVEWVGTVACYTGYKQYRKGDTI